MFIVIATHNTGHGEISSPILITKSILKAVVTARDIENFGYEFYSDEAGVGIYNLEPELHYRKYDFWPSGQIPPPTVTFYRKHCIEHRMPHFEGCWKEEWFDKKLENKCKERK